MKVKIIYMGAHQCFGVTQIWYGFIYIYKKNVPEVLKKRMI